MQLDIEEIADKADMIINGYAFTKDGDYIRVLNLNCVNHAAVILNNRIVKTKFNKCSKNYPTSSGSEMNCTSEHICSKKSL